MSAGEAIAIGLDKRALGWRDAVRDGVIALVVLAAYPKLGRWLLWPTRLRPRALAAYIAFNTVFGFALRTWALPYLERVAADVERVRTELAQTLGREPTDDEVFGQFRRTCQR